MMNRVRNAHAWAALLLLAAACDSGGGSDDDNTDGGSGKKDAAISADAETDGETPEEDTGVDEDGGPVDDDAGDTDAGGGMGGDDATVSMDADTDTGTPDTDTGTGGGTDAGTDSGPVVPTGCAETAIVAATGGSVTSSDSHFRLDLAAAGLSADSTVRVCLVPTATSVAGLDGRVGDAYEITTTPAATFSGSVTFTGHSALPTVDATAAFDPTIVRALPTGGTVANGAGAVLRLSKRALPADTVTRLSATISGPGHVFVAPLEATGIYRVDMRTPTKTTFVTGEVIDFSTIVTVTGSPVGARIFEAEINGCDLDPVNYANPAGVVNQPAPVRNNPNCSGNYVAISRVGGPTGNIVGGSAVGGAALTGGATYNLRDHDNTPLGLYCRFPRAAKGAARLFLKTGTTTDLEIVKDIEVTCTYSGDLLAFYDTLEMAPSGNSVAAGSSYVPGAYTAIAPPPVTATIVGDDGLRMPVPTAILSTAGPSTIEVDGFRYFGPTPAKTPTLSNVTLTYQADRYVATPAIPATPAFFGGLSETYVEVQGPSLTCFAANSGQLNLRYGPRAGAATSLSVTGSTVDVILVQARIPADGATPASLIWRWIDASKLGDHVDVPLLNAAQRTAIGGAVPTDYTVSLFNVLWNETQSLYDSRIVPIACGTVLHFEGADVLPPI